MSQPVLCHYPQRGLEQNTWAPRCLPSRSFLQSERQSVRDKPYSMVFTHLRGILPKESSVTGFHQTGVHWPWTCRENCIMCLGEQQNQNPVPIGQYYRLAPSSSKDPLPQSSCKDTSKKLSHAVTGSVYTGLSFQLCFDLPLSNSPEGGSITQYSRILSYVL